MIQNIVNNKGGLHNRISRKIRLLPFNLSETEEFLKSRSVTLNRYQILQIYMAMGGIPQYLKWILPGESASQAVDRLCFTKDGILKEEFKILYLSLFEKAQRHIDIVKALSQKGSGLKRNEIIEACNLSTGGTTTKILEELEESGFINAYIPFGKNAREVVYKLADEYSLFYLKFIENTRTTGSGTWLRLSSTPSWRSWSGIAFERICLKHIDQVKKGLGISAVQTTESIWRLQPKKDEAGAQIDLLIDRSDQCINLCEMKFSDAEFVITKEYESDLKRKSTVFKSTVKTRKTIFITLITTYGAKQNIYFTGNVQSQLTMEDLFGK